MEGLINSPCYLPDFPRLQILPWIIGCQSTLDPLSAPGGQLIRVSLFIRNEPQLVLTQAERRRRSIHFYGMIAQDLKIRNII